MTDEERKQFITEYCRNAGNIKIKCDDCKFVEDCVDYGWEGCKKFTQKQPHTNEEWLDTLSTEEKAEFSMRVFKNCTWCLDGGSPQECPFNAFLDCPAESKENMIKWLKGEHDG